MMKKTLLYTTDSYYNLFPILVNLLNGKTNTLSGKNIIFCEEKLSLMVERAVCDAFGGSFNTEICSFGNYLKSRINAREVLGKEGSAMVVKRVLSEVNLSSLSASKKSLAPTLYELINQLKSAKVSPEDALYSAQNVSGALKDKLTDISAVYSAYENFLKDKNLTDRSALLTFLPEAIEADADTATENVFLVGFSSFTRQTLSAVRTLIKKAASVSALLVGGKNEFLYLNETARVFKDVSAEAGVVCEEKFIPSTWSTDGKIIAENIYRPAAKNFEKNQTENVFSAVFDSAYAEAEAAATAIRAKVLEGARYGDFTVAVPLNTAYNDAVKSAFGALNVPYFFDEKYKAENHPLVSLIASYIDVFRKNFERGALNSFFKNPLFSDDKKFCDEFGQYLINYNVNFKRIFEPITEGFSTAEEIARAESFRNRILACFEKFDIKNLLIKLDAEKKVRDFTSGLIERGETVYARVNDQIYSAIIKILDDKERLLTGVKLSYTEEKNIFLSGVSALELSVIPSRRDAVFIGDWKETGLCQAKYLFALGLCGEVPAVKDDVALLSDGDIAALEDLKVLIEPKIRIVNDREKETVGIALASFKEKLFLFGSATDGGGKKLMKSETLKSVEAMFSVKKFAFNDGYLSEKQGLYSFATDCRDFSEGRTKDFIQAASFYQVEKNSAAVQSVLSRASSEVKIRLNEKKDKLVKFVSSPTAIEAFYSCPYSAFLSNILRINEERSPEVDAASVGNLSHEILYEYVKRLDEVKDKESSDRIFDEIADKTIKSAKFSRFLFDKGNSFSINRTKQEVREFCYNTYLSLAQSDFAPDKDNLEKKIILPLDGDVNLTCKIDRVDKYKDYYRVMDYKSGKQDFSISHLFSGVKLQLFLYAAALLGKGNGQKQDGENIQTAENKQNAKIAGVYYSPLSGDYVNSDKKNSYVAIGASINNEETLKAQDREYEKDTKSKYIYLSTKGASVPIDEQTLSDMIDYSLIMCKKALKEIGEGVIVSAPFKDECEYCAYSGMCDKGNFDSRSVSINSWKNITEALKNEEAAQKAAEEQDNTIKGETDDGRKD